MDFANLKKILQGYLQNYISNIIDIYKVIKNK